MKKKIACYVLSYAITKGMKSVGPKGLLKSRKSTELINCQINNVKHKNIDSIIITGFGGDKLTKKINDKKVSFIHNDCFEIFNYGYVLELIFNHYDFEKYAGCLIIDDGIIFDKKLLPMFTYAKNIDKSKILYFKSQSKSKKEIFNISFSIKNCDQIGHMFFNVSDNLWSEITYVDNSNLKNIKNNYKQSMRNMFLFEIINNSIENGLDFSTLQIKNSQVVKISGIKDSNKIRDYI